MQRFVIGADHFFFFSLSPSHSLSLSFLPSGVSLCVYTTRPSCSGAAESRERTDKNIGRWSWKRGEWKRVERGEMGFRHFFPWARENRTEQKRQNLPQSLTKLLANQQLTRLSFFSVLVASAPLCLSLCVCVSARVFVSFLALSCQIAQVKHSPWAKEQHPKMNDQIFRFRSNSV